MIYEPTLVKTIVVDANAISTVKVPKGYSIAVIRKMLTPKNKVMVTLVEDKI